jgi:hypothetical protein
MWAATIFWISTMYVQVPYTPLPCFLISSCHPSTGLPGVIAGFPESSNTTITDVFYWTPQVIGGTGFIISSLLLMVEVQKKWWRPNLGSLGWCVVIHLPRILASLIISASALRYVVLTYIHRHVGLWNLIGAIGFTLCGALGYASLASSGANYQSVLSTFWGGWAFLIGSIVQLWEAVWRQPGDASDESGKSGEVSDTK